jgi:hypothetical protein
VRAELAVRVTAWLILSERFCCDQARHAKEPAPFLKRALFQSSTHRIGVLMDIIPGSDLLSHTPAHAVPSAVAVLTSVFGMGTGVTLPL